MLKISGIYKIQSKCKPERCYIGSAVNIHNRWRMHTWTLEKNRHDNQRLQNHYNKYGIGDLEFSVLLGCDKEDLVKNEQYFIDTYNPYFNICKVAGNTLGYRHPQELKDKWSRDRKGVRPSPEAIEKSAKSRRGRKMPDSVKQKISKSHMGIGHTKETRKKLSKSHKGKKLTPEHIENIRIASTGRFPNEEVRKRISDGLKGHIVSSETRCKISKANKGRKPKPVTEETRAKLRLINKGIKRSEEFKQKCREREAKKKLKKLEEVCTN